MSIHALERKADRLGNATIPAHMHFTVLEPGKPPHWVDDVVFDGEFGVTEAYHPARVNRGGNGIITLTRADAGVVLVARRDIILERHPPDHR